MQIIRKTEHQKWRYEIKITNWVISLVCCQVMLLPEACLKAAPLKIALGYVPDDFWHQKQCFSVLTYSQRTEVNHQVRGKTSYYVF